MEQFNLASAHPERPQHATASFAFHAGMFRMAVSYNIGEVLFDSEKLR